MSLARRSLTSITWSSVANLAQLILLFIRSVLLSRWLPVEIFGIYAAAYAFIAITRIIPNFGMDGAFLHRAKQVQDEQQAAAVHFTLKTVLTIVWTVAMLIFAFLIPDTETTVALYVLIGTTAASHLMQTPFLILARRVVYRRIAIMHIVDAILTLSISLFLAQLGLWMDSPSLFLWALLCSHVITVILNILFFYVWRPVWRPQFAWNKASVRYFMSFGGRNMLSTLLVQLLDRIDDLWIATYMSNEALGFYSRAYRFASYPREIVARPITQVMQGTYAELKDRRQQLSQAFFRSNAILVRTGFFAAGLMILVAPEFIILLLTDKWLPMLGVFRLMLVFILLDPLKMTVVHLMVAMGDAARPIPIRLLQLAILLIGLFVLGPLYGIEGVVISVNIMLVVGTFLFFRQARDYVDFSPFKLFAFPTIAVIIGVIAGWAVLYVPGLPDSEWWTAAAKIAVFVPLYASVLVLFERNETLALVKNAYKQVRQG
jgi:O-antigen/teichoic acid export membrane protein